MAEIGLRGAEATKKKYMARGLEPGELGRLDTPQDAERWLRIIGQAVAEGRLKSRDADAGTRSVKVWLSAHEEGRVAERVNELRQQVAELKGRKLRSVK